MRFCAAHFDRIQSEVRDRAIKPEQISTLVAQSMAFDRPRADECPVCEAVARSADLAERRWLGNAVLAILARTVPREAP